MVVVGQHRPGDKHLYGTHTRAECYRHVLMVSVCAEKKVGPLMGVFKADFGVVSDI